MDGEMDNLLIATMFVFAIFCMTCLQLSIKERNQFAVVGFLTALLGWVMAILGQIT